MYMHALFCLSVSDLFHIYIGLIKRLLGNSTHVQFLVQADHVTNDKKGLNLASLLKRVSL